MDKAGKQHGDDRTERGPWVERVTARALRLPTEAPESDGTLCWDATTMIVVECLAQGVVGLGYSYAHAAAARLATDLLTPCVLGLRPDASAEASGRMARAVRNEGLGGVAAAAISAVDVALWDLRAKLLGTSLASVLGVARPAALTYASGGFTSSSIDALCAELSEYVRAGFSHVKIKVGRTPAHDVERVRAARAVLGPDVTLMVDANGAYELTQALAMAEAFAEFGVRWFEEPVSSDDLPGLTWLHERLPPDMRLAAGEYGYTPHYFERMLSAGAVDVLQADATRCLGVTGFMQADALCRAHHRPLSSHCAPALHRHLALAASQLVHLEYFRDHARMEAIVFEGADAPVAGFSVVDLQRPGLGLTLRPTEVQRFLV
jgi:L-alanine-DL-glutamate epimerase-like enolase superfamily enzyme